jgi:hypothetical protein
MAEFITHSFDEEGYDYEWKRGAWLLVTVAVLCVAVLAAYIYLTEFYLQLFFAAFLLCKGILEMLFAKIHKPDLGFEKLNKGFNSYASKAMRKSLEFQLGCIDIIFCTAMVYTLFGQHSFWGNVNVIILLYLLVETFWINLLVSADRDENFEKIYRIAGGLSMLLFAVALITIIWAKNSLTLISFCLLLLFVVKAVTALGMRNKVNRRFKRIKWVPTSFTPKKGI